MGDAFHRAYGEYIYEDDIYDDEEDYIIDSSEYIPRIEGTELECGITFLSFNYLPILTSRVIKGKRNYYLFDFIKVWSSSKRDNL